MDDYETSDYEADTGRPAAAGRRQDQEGVMIMMIMIIIMIVIILIIMIMMIMIMIMMVIIMMMMIIIFLKAGDLVGGKLVALEFFHQDLPLVIGEILHKIIYNHRHHNDQ